MSFYCIAQIGSAMFVPQIDRMLKQHLTFIKRTGRPLKTRFLPTPAPVFSQISCVHLPNWRRTATQGGRWFLHILREIGNKDFKLEIKTSSCFFDSPICAGWLTHRRDVTQSEYVWKLDLI